MLSARRIRIAIVSAILAVGLAVPSHASAACANANANPHDVSLAASKAATLCLLNRIRRDKGMRRFRHNRRLSRASQGHTNAMARRNFFQHGDFIGRIRDARYMRGARGWTVGENIAWGSFDYGTPKSIVRGWMNSPGHRANILNRRFREIGIGITRGAPVPGMARGATYATNFGARF